MVAVAAGFALDPGVMIRSIGVGMAAAIVLDVTVVRLVLVPAAMTAMGEANWWLRRWLDRLLPRRRKIDLKTHDVSGTDVSGIREESPEPAAV